MRTKINWQGKRAAPRECTYLQSPPLLVGSNGGQLRHCKLRRADRVIRVRENWVIKGLGRV
jgi:hypothetical protein